MPAFVMQWSERDAEGWMIVGKYAVRLAVAGMALLANVACGGGDDDAGDGRATACAPVAAADAVVDQDSLRFSPNTLCVSPGQEVLFRNSESTIHTVTIEGKNESGTMKKGDEFRWTPPEPGRFDITCEFHPQMKAIVTVFP